MSIVPDEDMPTIIHINRPGPMRETPIEDLGERWCFKCRKRRTFHYTLTMETEPSWYGPAPAIKCEQCKAPDSDLFPGRIREWDE